MALDIRRQYVDDASGRPLAITYRKNDIYNSLVGMILLSDYRDVQRNGLSLVEKIVGSTPFIRKNLYSRFLYEIGHREYSVTSGRGAGIDTMRAGYHGLIEAHGNMITDAFQQLYVKPLVQIIVHGGTKPIFHKKKRYRVEMAFEIVVKEGLSKLLERAIMADMKQVKGR